MKDLKYINRLLCQVSNNLDTIEKYLLCEQKTISTSGAQLEEALLLQQQELSLVLAKLPAREQELDDEDQENVEQNMSRMSISKNPPQKSVSFNGNDRQAVALNEKTAPKLSRQETVEITALTVQELSTVPKYMLINRLDLSKINAYIAQFNRVIAEKYRILAQPQGKMSKETRLRYWAFQESHNADTADRVFVTDMDIKKCKGTKFRMDPTGRAVISVLRHCKRIKESRGSGQTRFILV